MLKKWLNLIFGCDGPKTIQTMQEWSQSRFDTLFDEEKTVELLEGSITNDLEHQPNGKTNVNVMKDGIRHGITGYFHEGKLVGNVEIIRYDINGFILSKEVYFCKKGCPHGYYLNYQKQDCNEFCHFGIYLNGVPFGPEWTCIPPETYIFKNYPSTVVTHQERNNADSIFIYPDLHTALFGNFEPQWPFMIIEAFACEITSINITPFGILQPITNKNAGLKNLTRDDQIDPISICKQPLLEDPYEKRTVEVKNSLISNAGQGLFAKRPIDKGQIVAYFHGIPSVSSSMYCYKYSEYSISHHDGNTDVIDIPEDCRNTEKYCATLAHKICHSFGPNAQYSYAFHPRFGRIRCVIAIKYIQNDEEITCNYKYKLEKAPEWYKEDLKMYLKNNYDYVLSDSEINQILTSSC